VTSNTISLQAVLWVQVRIVMRERVSEAAFPSLQPYVSSRRQRERERERGEREKKNANLSPSI
jgi:hypothetical protein